MSAAEMMLEGAFRGGGSSDGGGGESRVAPPNPPAAASSHPASSSASTAAASVASSAAAASPAPSAESFSRAACRAHDAGDLPAALVLYSAALDLDPAHLPAWIGRGVARKQSGQLSEAVEDYTRAMQLCDGAESKNDPGLVATRLLVLSNRANCLTSAGQLLAALQDHHAALQLSRSIASRSPDPVLHVNRGSTLVKLGRLAEAREDYEAALGIDPTYAFAWYNLGLVQGRCGATEECVKAFRKAAELFRTRHAHAPHHVTDCERQIAYFKAQSAALNGGATFSTASSSIGTGASCSSARGIVPPLPLSRDPSHRGPNVDLSSLVVPAAASNHLPSPSYPYSSSSPFPPSTFAPSPSLFSPPTAASASSPRPRRQQRRTPSRCLLPGATPSPPQSHTPSPTPPSTRPSCSERSPSGGGGGASRRALSYRAADLPPSVSARPGELDESGICMVARGDRDQDAESEGMESMLSMSRLSTSRGAALTPALTSSRGALVSSTLAGSAASATERSSRNSASGLASAAFSSLASGRPVGVDTRSPFDPLPYSAPSPRADSLSSASPRSGEPLLLMPLSPPAAVPTSPARAKRSSHVGVRVHKKPTNPL